MSCGHLVCDDRDLAWLSMVICSLVFSGLLEFGFFEWMARRQQARNKPVKESEDACH